MSKLHLTTDSEQPAKVDGKLRLYSMEFCPYVQRVKLVLEAKGLDYDICNVNLVNKPTWLFKLHPKGLVPILDFGDKIMTESMDICNYLDEQHPNPPLYSAEPALKEAEVDLIKKIGELIRIFNCIIMQTEERSAEEWLKEFAPHLTIFENELEKRGTKYFGGDAPNMLDFMLWPWAERAPIVNIMLGVNLPLGENDYKLLRTWRKTMRKHPIAEKFHHPVDKFHKTILIKTGKIRPDYDNL